MDINPFDQFASDLKQAVPPAPDAPAPAPQQQQQQQQPVMLPPTSPPQQYGYGYPPTSSQPQQQGMLVPSNAPAGPYGGYVQQPMYGGGYAPQPPQQPPMPVDSNPFGMPPVAPAPVAPAPVAPAPANPFDSAGAGTGADPFAMGPPPAAPPVPPPAAPPVGIDPFGAPPAAPPVPPTDDPFGAPSADPFGSSMPATAPAPVGNDLDALFGTGAPAPVAPAPSADPFATSIVPAPAPETDYEDPLAGFGDDFGAPPASAPVSDPEASVPSGNGELPSGGEYYDAKIFTPTLGVMFFKPQELTDSLFLQTEKEIVDGLGDRPVVSFIVEGSSARSAGVELGHVLLKVNGVDVKNPKEASRLIKEGPRPLPLLFYVPNTTVVVAEGEHMVKYDTKETNAPNSHKDWKPKYVVIGGIIAQPWMINMYRSKSEYDIAVIETQARRPVSVKVKQFSLQGARIQNDWQGPQMVKYKNQLHPWKFIVVLPVVGNPIKISSPNLSALKPVHEGIRRYLASQGRQQHPQHAAAVPVQARNNGGYNQGGGDPYGGGYSGAQGGGYSGGGYSGAQGGGYGGPPPPQQGGGYNNDPYGGGGGGYGGYDQGASGYGPPQGAVSSGRRNHY